MPRQPFPTPRPHRPRTLHTSHSTCISPFRQDTPPTSSQRQSAVIVKQRRILAAGAPNDHESVMRASDTTMWSSGHTQTAPAAGDIGNIAVGHEMTSQVRDERGGSPAAAHSREGLHRRAAHRLRGLVVPSGRRPGELVSTPRCGHCSGSWAATRRFCCASEIPRRSGKAPPDPWLVRTVNPSRPSARQNQTRAVTLVIPS